MTSSDKCLSFHLQEGAFKGHFCRLSTSITDALKMHNYPLRVNQLLAEMAAISHCFSADIKSGSKTTMQLTGTSPLKLALVNSQDSKFFRCCATLAQDILDSNATDTLSIPNLFGQNGKLVFTIEFSNHSYQTIIELSAANLQDCIQHYFIQSQQIPTIILLFSKSSFKATESAALLLQATPESPGSNFFEFENDTWHHLSCLAATLKDHELLSSGPAMEHLLNLVFNQLNPVVSRETSLSFKCTCSYERIVDILKRIQSENKSNMDEDLHIRCESCGKKYSVDKVSIGS